MARDPAAPDAGHPEDARREYRIEELASLTSTTVRSLQSYRNRGLLPPPRREGRVAWYSDVHVERLRLIADLISRGYSLAAIAELFDGLGRGEHIHDLLGVEAAADRATEAEVVTPRQVAAVIGEGPDALTAAVEMGMFAPLDDADEGNPADRPYAVLLPENLRAGAALVGAGIPAEDVIAEGLRLRADAEAIADRFVGLAVDYVFERRADDGVPDDAASLTELATELVPYAGTVISEMVQAALRARLHAEVERQLGRLIADRDRRTAGS